MADRTQRIYSDLGELVQAEPEWATAEIERLRSWKAEATEVLGSWEEVWEALGRPGRLGESKAAAVLRAVKNGRNGE